MSLPVDDAMGESDQSAGGDTMTDVGTPPTFDTDLPLWRELTWTDLETSPDEQYWRYELVDGGLLVATSRDRSTNGV